MLNHFKLLLLSICLLANAGFESAVAQDAPLGAVSEFITEDVIAIGYIDLTKLDIDATLKFLGTFGYDGTMQYRKLLAELPRAKEHLAAFKKAGITKGYAVLRASDIENLSTTIVLPLAKNSDEESAIQAISKVRKESLQIILNGYEIISQNGCLVIRVNDSSSPRSDTKRSEMWKAIGNGTVGLAIFGDRDSRRIVKDLMPQLPTPFDALNGQLIAEHTKWIGLSAKLNGTPQLDIQLETNDESSAKTYQELATKAWRMAQSLPILRSGVSESDIKLVFDAIKPNRTGSRVSVSTKALGNDLDRLAKTMAPAMDSTRDAARQTQTKNSLRQHILSMLNFESAYRHFPPQAIMSKTGKPLLSWRVQVLPFLEQSDLYNQFKLDEPWDSEHNIKLVEKMPEVYWNPNSDFFEMNEAGKTIFQTPAGKDLIFHQGKKTRFRDIIDGSSNTISVVAMPAEMAVPWTKPVDWQVDMQNPLQTIAASDQTELIYAHCDGSVNVTSIEKLKPLIIRMIKPADGEVVEMPN